MSIVKTLDVFCDAPGCGLWVDGWTGTKATAKEARRAAAAAGWVRRDGRDLCPYHAENERTVA